MKNFFDCLVSFGLIVSISCSLFGCSYKNHKYIKYHVVKKGDTLYSVAKKHNLRLEHLAKINCIKFPYAINKGRKLILVDHNKLQRLVLKTRSPQHVPVAKNSNIYSVKPTVPPAVTKKVITASKNTEDSIKYPISKDWAWPALGKIVKTFTIAGPCKVNGVGIAGNRGDPIVSTANGKVVYSGNNLRGYGNLVIIKHNQDFLSAYAHNEKILVKEQQEVKKGQQIATMGDSDAKSVLLHFEVRYKGKPIDPLKLLVHKQ